jgi:hypothetical protein
VEGVRLQRGMAVGNVAINLVGGNLVVTLNAVFFGGL